MSRPVQGDGGEPAGGCFAKWSWTPGPPDVQLKVADSRCRAGQLRLDRVLLQPAHRALVVLEARWRLGCGPESEPGNPAPVRHPRLPVHRRQARHQRPHRPARRPRRPPLDATHTRPPITRVRRSHHVTGHNPAGREECLPYLAGLSAPHRACAGVAVRLIRLRSRPWAM